MKKLLQYFHRSLGKFYCIFYGILILLGTIAIIPLMSMSSVFINQLFFFILVTCCVVHSVVLFMASSDKYEKSFISSEVPVPKFFTIDERGKAAIVSVDQTPKKQIELQVTGEKKTRDDAEDEFLIAGEFELYDRFCRLKELYEDELITEEEYNAKKKQLLEKL